MSPEADPGQIEVQRGPPRLIIGILGLALIDVAVWLLGRFTEIEPVFLIGLALPLPIAYMAWLILRAREWFQSPQETHPLDAWVCRWSGPLAVCLFVVEFGCMALTNVLPEWKILRRPGVFALLHHVAGFGLLFSCLCLWVRPRIGRAPNRIWRRVAVPLLLIFVLEFILWAVFPLLSGSSDTPPPALARLWDKDAATRYHVKPPAPIAQVDRATVS